MKANKIEGWDSKTAEEILVTKQVCVENKD